MKLQGLFGVALTALFGTTAHGQLVVNTVLTPEQLVQDVLVGNCVTVSNVSFNGAGGSGSAGVSAGSFMTAGATALGLSAGVILATGDVTLAAQPESFFASTQPGTGSDPDLALLSGQTISDRSVLEFDFVPNGDSISFRFIFASEEYELFECSQWNDAFGFFLSGPGISGPFSNNAINLAVVPGTTVPITINTVNSGLDDDFNSYCVNADPNWQDNSAYYYNNGDGPDVVYYGFTTVLTAKAAVQCDQVYHIKLAVGDGADASYDSAVFLEAGSFASDPFVPTLAPSAGIVGSVMFESCLQYTMGFVRVACDLSTPQTVYLGFDGTAEMGVDITPAFPDSLIFEPGVEVVTIDFFVPQDPDDVEEMSITTQTVDCEGNPTTATFTFSIAQVEPLEVQELVQVVACGQSITLAPQITGGYGQYEYLWSDGSQDPTVTLSPTGTTTMGLQVSDMCNLSASGSQQVTLSPAPNFNMSVFGSSDLREGCDNGTVNFIRPQSVQGVPYTIVLTGGGTATLNEDYTIPGEVVIPSGVLSVQQQVIVLEDALDEGDEVITITGTATNACGQTVSASVSLDIIDVDPFFVSVPTVLIECSDDSLELVPVVTGGVQPYQYLWEDGEVTASLWVHLREEGAYPVTVTDACNRQASAIGGIQLDCEVIIPNVFSPNNDGKNDRWEIAGLGSRPNTVRLFNRWGALVFDVKNYRNSFAAQDVPDGTYFYEIVVDGKDEPFTGHLTILRN